MSVQDDIQNSVVSIVGALGLQFNGTNMPVSKRKIPLRQAGIDPAAQILVTINQDANDDSQWVASQILQVTYRQSITFIVPNNADESTNLPSYSDWVQQIRYAFTGWSLAGVPSVYGVKVLKDQFLTRTEISANYDYITVPIEFTSFEPVTITE